MKSNFRKFCLLCLLCKSTITNAQIWIFGDSCRIDFVNGNTIVSKANCSGETSSVLQYPTGFIYASAREKDMNIPNGSYAGGVYNVNGQRLNQNAGLLLDGKFNHLIIIPNPNDSTKAYIFQALYGSASQFTLHYSTVNIYGSGGVGAMLQVNVPLMQGDISDCMNVIRHGNGRDWWLYVRECNSQGGPLTNLWFRFLIDPSGIHGPYTQNAGQLSYTNIDALVFNPEGTKAVYITQSGIIDLFDIDRCTGLFTNYQMIHAGLPQFPQPPYPPGFHFSRAGTFSESGRYLYTTAGYNSGVDTGYVLQFDMQAVDIWASVQIIHRFPKRIHGRPYYPCELKLAPDHKIYLTGYTWGYPYPDTLYDNTNMYLSVINDPDSAGPACNFSPFSFYLGGNRVYSCLPDMPDYKLGPAIGSGCDTLLATGISPQENETAAMLQCWPNPVQDLLNIRWGGVSAMTELKIFSSEGKHISNLIYNTTENQVEMDVSALPAAVYVLEMQTSQGEIFRKKFSKLRND